MPLPSLIQRLSTSRSIHPDDIHLLPPNLVHLSMRNDDPDDFKNSDDNIDESNKFGVNFTPEISSISNGSFRRWESHDFDRLPSDSLQWMHLKWSVVAQGSSLSSISKFQNLRFLSIAHIRLDYPANESPYQWLCDCLPPKLTSLHLTHSGVARNPKSKNSIEWLRLCDLRTRTPDLEELSIVVIRSDDLPLGPFFDSLPEKLTSLKISYFSNFVEVDALSHLPRSLIAFSMRLISINKFKISDQHLSGLPPRLARIEMFGSPVSSLTSNALDLLPSTVSYTYFFGGDFAHGNGLQGAAKTLRQKKSLVRVRI